MVERVLAVDPGSKKSAWVLIDPDGTVLDKGIDGNEGILYMLDWRGGDTLAMEMVASYGMPVGKDVFETVLWAGRMIEAHGGDYHLIYRQDVKMALCGSNRARDSNIRQRLIDLYGPGKERAIGTKKEPGPLYGFKKDMWAALGVGVTYQRIRLEELRHA